MFTAYDLFSLEILFIGSWIQVFERKMSDGSSTKPLAIRTMD